MVIDPFGVTVSEMVMAQKGLAGQRRVLTVDPSVDPAVMQRMRSQEHLNRQVNATSAMQFLHQLYGNVVTLGWFL